jgi:hypothetical protein
MMMMMMMMMMTVIRVVDDDVCGLGDIDCESYANSHSKWKTFQLRKQRAAKHSKQ